MVRIWVGVYLCVSCLKIEYQHLKLITLKLLTTHFLNFELAKIQSCFLNSQSALIWHCLVLGLSVNETLFVLHMQSCEPEFFIPLLSDNCDFL